ncbi:hypothetical protein TrRE_jg5278, partial [Triparma retinervis]
MDGVSVTSGSGGNFRSSTNKSSVMMPNRKTPYEVWAAIVTGASAW